MFIGQKEVQEVLEVEGSHYPSNVIVFKDWTKKQYTLKALKYLVSEEAVDENDLREKITTNIASEIIGIFEQHDLEFFDVGVSLRKAEWSLIDYQERSTSKALLWEDYEEGKTGQQNLMKIRISDALRVLNP